MAEGIYKITEQFEQALCDYTGAKYAVSVDNQSNALFLALMYENVKDIFGGGTLPDKSSMVHTCVREILIPLSLGFGKRINFMAHPIWI